jgi:hypothetical protein
LSIGWPGRYQGGGIITLGHYESRFIGPERLCSLGTSRLPNNAPEPPRWQQDGATAEHEGFDACRLSAQPTVAGARSWGPLERKDLFLE